VLSCDVIIWDDNTLLFLFFLKTSLTHPMQQASNTVLNEKWRYFLKNDANGHMPRNSTQYGSYLKFAKSAIMTPKKLFMKNINTGIKKQNFMRISNWLMTAFKNAPKK
jgi:hypothetical protein